MSTKSICAAFMVAAVAGLATGCQTTHTLTRRSELLSVSREAQVKVLSKDSVLYDLKKIYLRDSTLYGEGVARTSTGVEQFKGEIALTNIQYIQSSDLDTWKTVLAVGAVAFVGGTAYSYLNDNTSGLAIGATKAWFDPRYAYYPGGGGNSCPYLYSWNGEHYVLEAEAYGVAWGKALEMETVSSLPSLRADHGTLNVRLTNERPETHYYNAVSLVAVECDENAEVVADPSGGLWPVYQLCSPLRAVDGEGDDILERIVGHDGIYWKSALCSVSPGSAYEDVIEVVLPKTAPGKEGMIVVRAINTSIIDVVFRKLGDLLGADYLTFLRELEHDPELIGLMKEWIVESSLKVDLWDGTAWKSVGSILPEANAVAFTRGVRVNAERMEGGSIRVRLRCLAGVWNIDEIGIDWTPAVPLHPSDVRLLSAVGPEDRNVIGALERVDEKYVIVLPGQEINLKYRATRSEPSMKVTYALGVRGYLHEWLPGTGSGGASIITASMVGETKVAYLKTLLRMKDAFLPPIYAEWKQRRQ
jgi:hypothetical protein